MRAGVSVLLRWILLEWVVFDTVRCIIISGAGIFILAVAGFRAAPLTLALGLFLGGVILRCSIAIPFFWCIHHVYVMSWGGFPVPGGRWFLVVSGIVVHTVDVFRVIV